MTGQHRRAVTVLLISVLLLASTATPAAAEPPISIDESGMAAAPSFEPTRSLIAEVEGDGAFYFYVSLFNTGPSMSPNAEWVVFNAGNGYEPLMTRLHVRSGSTRPIGDRTDQSANHVISNDGRYVAFEGVRTELWDSSTAAVTDIGGNLSGNSVSMSNDGRVVAWNGPTDDDGSTAVVWSAGDRRAWPAGFGTAAISGNGRYLFHVEGIGDGVQHVRRDLETGDLVSHPGFGDNEFPAVASRSISHDGSLVISSGPWRQDYHLGSAVTLHRLPTDSRGGTATAELEMWNPLLQSSMSLPPAFLSGDGSTILLGSGATSVESGHRRSHYLVDTTTGAVRRAVIPFAMEPVGLSSDGTRAVFYENIDLRSYRLWMVDFDASSTPVEHVRHLARPQLSDQVRRMYSIVLGRAPSPTEVIHWTRQRAGGVSAADVAQQIVDSAEFARRYPSLSNEAFLGLLLDRVDRSEDGEDWIRELNAGRGRGAVAAEVADLPQTVDATDTAWPTHPEAAQVWRLYQAYFGRPADQRGLNYWFARYWSDMPLDEISDHMAASTEFARRYGTLADAGFVQQVYENVLGRPPDPSGRRHWTGRLASGMTRGEMMLAFSDSPEFIRRTDTLPPGP